MRCESRRNLEDKRAANQDQKDSLNVVTSDFTLYGQIELINSTKVQSEKWKPPHVVQEREFNIGSSKDTGRVDRISKKEKAIRRLLLLFSR